MIIAYKAGLQEKRFAILPPLCGFLPCFFSCRCGPKGVLDIVDAGLNPYIFIVVMIINNNLVLLNS